jgi:uroporphyrinogen-III synthase
MPDMKPNLPLSEWTVLSLRPYGQHAVAHCASKLRGAKFLSCSSMKLEAIKNDDKLKNALACDYIIVTSPAAARFAGQSQVFSVPKNAQWFAIGEGTALVLRKFGACDIALPNAGGNSENLLAMTALQDLRGRSVGLITAPGGRGLIEPELVRRGALVDVAHVYQRKVIPVSQEQLESVGKLHPPFAVLCSSYEIFQSFWQQMTPALQQKLKAGLWVLSSLRLQGLLNEVGISNATISISAQPEAMLAHLEHVQTQQVR